MNHGLYHSAIAISRGARAQELHAENIANAHVPGYRRNEASFGAFGSMFDQAMGAGSDFKTFSVTRVFEQGTLDQSRNKYDLALEGPGFLTVQGPGGETLYTRAGNLTLGADATLQTHDGRQVLGTSGAIRLDPNGPEPEVGIDGTVSQGDVPVGQLRIVEFPEPYPLTLESSVYFRAQPGAIPGEPDNTQVRQGYRETSNVNIMEEMITMMSSFRQFEKAQKVMTTINGTLQQLLSRASS